MLGPGAYGPDPTEGITPPEDLPKPRVVQHTRNLAHRPCPRCGKSCSRDRGFTRVLHDVGDLLSGRPRESALTSSQHDCCTCRTYCNADAAALAPSKSQDTPRVIALAGRLVVEDGFPSATARWHLWRAHRVFVPYATLQHWVEAGGKKGGPPDGDQLPGWGLGRLFRLHRRGCTVRWPVRRAVHRRESPLHAAGL